MDRRPWFGSRWMASRSGPRFCPSGSPPPGWSSAASSTGLGWALGEPDLDHRRRVRHRLVPVLDRQRASSPADSGWTSSPSWRWSAPSPSGSTWPVRSSSVMLASGRALEGWAAGRARRELQAFSNEHLSPLTATRTVASPVAVEEVCPVTSSSCLREMLCRWMARSCRPQPSSTSRRSPGNRSRRALCGRTGPQRSGQCRLADRPPNHDQCGGQHLCRHRPPGRRGRALPGSGGSTGRPLCTRLSLLTLVVAGIAWSVGGASRAVAVLVVATPCPLILAAPVALVSGLSRAAKRGVIVKGGAVLERMATCTTLLIDKTGTMTVGHPVLTEIVCAETLPADDPPTGRLARPGLSPCPRQRCRPVRARAGMRSSASQPRSRRLPARASVEWCRDIGDGGKGVVDRSRPVLRPGPVRHVARRPLTAPSPSSWASTVPRPACWSSTTHCDQMLPGPFARCGRTG